MFHTRALCPEDQQQLWRWLHIALWDPPPAPLRPIEILEHPMVRIYAEDYGKPSDVGVVGLVGDNPIPVGACWMRLLPAGVGLAYVDDMTPQLGIALEPEHQHKGYGSKLMQGALDAARSTGYKQVALTVHPENSAIRLYERCGFEKIEIRSTYHLMIARL